MSQDASQDTTRTSTATTQDTPDIDYLSRDFASFRRQMLDRLATISPGTASGHPADMGTVLVEVLSQAADELSMFQDAVATEAYLATARLRTSVRRHARLLDYRLHDGCNARVWVTVAVSDAADGQVLPQGTRLLSRVEGQPTQLGEDDIRSLRSRGALVFETMQSLLLRSAHSVMALDVQAGPVLAGAQSAQLAQSQTTKLALRVGDVVIFEQLAVEAGAAAALDRRHAVRLTSVTDTSTSTAVGALKIGWSLDDALPFALDPRRTQVLGNVVLADHGYTLPDAELIQFENSRARPQLLQGPLTWQTMVLSGGQALRFDPNGAAASVVPTEILPSTMISPVISLVDEVGQPWQARRDLLSSAALARDFVVETEDDGRTYLRFGDGVYGRLAQGPLFARYRIGNGSTGNIGADSLSHIGSLVPGIRSVRNPLPARGGKDPEPLDRVRNLAPRQFQVAERAVTTEDYAQIALRFPTVREVRAMRRYTGSFFTTRLFVVRFGGLPVDESFCDSLLAFLAHYRMAGHVLRIDAPVKIPLDIRLTVGVKSGHFRGDVVAALSAALGPGTASRPGFFHPDRQSLGQPVYLSRLIRAAMDVKGVAWVECNRFRRYFSSQTTDDDVIVLRPTELASVENIPTQKSRGFLELVIGGKP
jgi:hypothetical protein